MIGKVPTIELLANCYDIYISSVLLFYREGRHYYTYNNEMIFKCNYLAAGIGFSVGYMLCFLLL